MNPVVRLCDGMMTDAGSVPHPDHPSHPDYAARHAAVPVSAPEVVAAPDDLIPFADPVDDGDDLDADDIA